jgi:hypothetical protein
MLKGDGQSRREERAVNARKAVKVVRAIPL